MSNKISENRLGAAHFLQSISIFHLQKKSFNWPSIAASNLISSQNSCIVINDVDHNDIFNEIFEIKHLKCNIKHLISQSSPFVDDKKRVFTSFFFQKLFNKCKIII